VHDPALVRVLERAAQRESDTQHVAVRQHAGRAQAVERLAVHELGDEIARVASSPASNTPTNRGGEPRGGERLALPAGSVPAIGAGDHLDATSRRRRSSMAA